MSNANEVKENRNKRFNNLKESFNEFKKTLSQDTIEKMETSIQIFIQAYKMNSKGYDNSRRLTKDELETRIKELRQHAIKLDESATIDYLENFCDGREHAEEVFNNMDDSSILKTMVTSSLQNHRLWLKTIKSKLAYPDNNIWKYSIPLQGNVKYTKNGVTKTYDLGITWDGHRWCRAIAIGNEGGEYFSGDVDWLRNQYYKDTFDLACKYGFMGDKDKIEALKDAGYWNILFKSPISKLKTLFNNEEK